MKNFILIGWIFLLSVCYYAQSTKTATQKVPVSIEKSIDAIFKQYDKLDSPGVAVAVLQDGETIFLKGYGSANLEHKIPIDPTKTRFNIGSTSKQVTVFAALLLADQKKLSMDDDVRKHIPELHDFGQKITLRDLAYHRSGIRSELSLLAMAGWSPGDVMTRRNVLEMIYRQKDLNFNPGEESSYSNSGYTLLSEVVERVSGKSFADFAHENIFAPLGMTQTFFLSHHQNLVSNMAYSYGMSQNGHYKINSNFGYSGSTGVFTTASDFSKWARNFSTLKVGSKKVLQEMNSLGKLTNGETYGFAMGQFIEKYKGLNHIQHGGGTAGYISYLGRFPDQRFNVILMGNSSSINARGKSLEVADVFLNKYFREPTLTEPKQIDIDLSKFKYEGHYWDSGAQNSVRISVGDNAVIFAIGGGPRITLAPSGIGEFQMLNIGIDRRVRFKTKRNGKRSMHVFVNDKEVETFKAYTPKKYSVSELKNFEGTYYSEELDVNYVLSVENGGLVVTHLRFSDNALLPVISDVFRNTSWRFSTLKFKRGSNGNVTGFLISSMRAKNIAFNKVPTKTRNTNQGRTLR